MCFLQNPIIPLGKMAFFVIYHQNNTFKKKNPVKALLVKDQDQIHRLTQTKDLLIGSTVVGMLQRTCGLFLDWRKKKELL